MNDFVGVIDRIQESDNIAIIFVIFLQKVSETAASALLSGFSASIALQPFDFIKTRLQVDSLTR